MLQACAGKHRRVWIAILGFALWHTANAAAAFDRFPADLGWINVQSDHQAIGDGIHDDTAAFHSALAACAKHATAEHVTLFIPPGTYRLSDTLKCPPGVTLQGAGTGESLLVLAPQSDGFDDPHAPRPCLDFPGSDDADPELQPCWNYVFDLTSAARCPPSDESHCVRRTIG